MWEIVALGGLAAGALGLVSILYPLRFLHIRSRLQGLGLAFVGLVAMIVAGINLPQTTNSAAVETSSAALAVTQTPVPPPAPPAATTPAAPPKPKLPEAQLAFIEAAQAGRAAYRSAETDFQKGAARPARAKALCKAISAPQVKDWIGKLTDLTTNSDGKGVVEITIADHVTVSTWNNSISDIVGETLIDPSSPLFQQLGQIKEGDTVVFSGRLIRADTDCFQEKSMTLGGSMNDPDYLFRFSSVRRAQP